MRKNTQKIGGKNLAPISANGEHSYCVPASGVFYICEYIVTDLKSTLRVVQASVGGQACINSLPTKNKGKQRAVP